MLYNFGELKGIKGLKKSRRLEIMPFALGDFKTMEKATGNPFTKKERYGEGMQDLMPRSGFRAILQSI